MALYGVDVHDGYQAGLSFPVLARQGYTFAAVKLTQGTDYTRDMGDDWVRAARDAGLIPGGYHWLNSSDGAVQARWFHRKVVECGGPEGMLIQLDCEDNGYGPQMRAWTAEWARLTGGHPFLIYSGAWWWNDPNRPMRPVRGVDLTPYLWHSRYITADTDTAPDDPAAVAAAIPATYWTPGYGGWPRATFLQFTSKGDAGSLANKVDLNVYLGTRAQLLALTTKAGAATPSTSEVDMYEKFDRDRVAATFETVARIEAALTAIAKKVDIDPAELDAIKQASAAASVEAIRQAAPDLVEAIIAKLPDGGVASTMTRGDIELAVREVFADAAAPDLP
jgi:GH25 family lysozyme M1 (1,4-beta-N-acetylmuramidase)